MPFGVGHFPLIAILLVVVLIIFGPGKLPELGSSLGKAIREFKSHTSELHNAVAAPAPAAIPAVDPIAFHSAGSSTTVTPEPAVPAVHDRVLSGQ